MPLCLLEAGVEKRVFSLATREEGCCNVYAGVVLIFAVLHYLGYERDWSHLTVGSLILASLVWLQRYVSDRNRRLEVSDEGLVLTWWPRRAVSIGWDQVRSIKPVPWYALSNSTWPSSIALMRVKDAAGRAIVISDACAEYEEIMEIIKQRLPEGMFQVDVQKV